MSAVAQGVGLGSLAHRGWHPSSTAVGDPQLRQSYITRTVQHGRQSVAELLLWPPPLRALRGYTAGVMQNCLRWSGRTAVGAPRSLLRPTRRHLYALVSCWHLGISQALRACVLISGLRPCITVCPAHPWGLLAAQHRPRGLPVRPQGAPCSAALGWGQGVSKQALRACCYRSPLSCAGCRVRSHGTVFGAALMKQSYIRPYIVAKEKGFATNLISANPFIHWCRRDESNTRPSHYE